MDAKAETAERGTREGGRGAWTGPRTLSLRL